MLIAGLERRAAASRSVRRMPITRPSRRTASRPTGAKASFNARYLLQDGKSKMLAVSGTEDAMMKAPKGVVAFWLEAKGIVVVEGHKTTIAKLQEGKFRRRVAILIGRICEECPAIKDDHDIVLVSAGRKLQLLYDGEQIKVQTQLSLKQVLQKTKTRSPAKK